MPEITPEDVARLPAPGMAVPTAIAFSPDDSVLSFLASADRTLQRNLYAYDVATGTRRLLVAPDAPVREENQTLEEKLQRERSRDLGIGVTRYAWADDADVLVVPLPDGLHVRVGAGDLRRVVEAGDAPILDPRLSRDGTMLAFVRERELHVVAVTSGQPRRLTTGADDAGVSHGLADFIAQEEMHRFAGYWWSRDGKWLAYTEVDESHIPVYRIVHQGSAAVGEAAQEDHRYPFAGARNAAVRIGIVSVSGGETRWLDSGVPDSYIAEVHWLHDGSLVVLVEDRTQTRVDVVRFDLASGARTVLLTQMGDPWINLGDLFRSLRGGGFLWLSEASGFRHLYRYGADGDAMGPLTKGEWTVLRVDEVDEDREIAYVSATEHDPRETHLYAVPLGGGDAIRLTPEPGVHTIAIDHARRCFADSHNSVDRPPTVRLRSLEDGRVLDVIHEDSDPRVEAIGLRPPALFSFENRIGTTLYGAMYEPTIGTPPYATVVWVYGGPGAQLVVNGWSMTAAMRAQFLRGQGFLVLVVDNRGSARRGVAFESAIWHDLGRAEIEDQVDGVRWAVEQGLADPARVGIYGWSYGGYLAALALGRAPETFKAAVAGAPVTHWDGYDTHYTERYMGTPAANPEGYERSSVMAHVGEMTGRLMLVHGLIDENVHFRHTARLVNALIRAGKQYELLLFPDERHTPRGEDDRTYMERRICSFFEASL